ncbi:3-phosphoshikimate 1-carboxyvinyltransferase [Stieleria marina]|uniref:3-phosphoshikimate 1-carboxyvinyltransferase n=1 Tax=Stieleria marina TaxID=1930275 RepID=A0A517NTG8_9BACT|nr:3-phosphoshikimate 1-carboxyvinyltransferase [Planctomycetes bacterium K23_9]
MSPKQSTPADSQGMTVVEVLPGGPVCGSIQPPGSKSLTNRALLCAAFADGVSTLSGALRSEDTEVMIEAIESIGVSVVATDGGRSLVVDAVNRSQLKAADHRLDLFIANSGTTIRFLTAALSAAGGHFLLHGVERMHERPIADLIDALVPVQEGSIATQSPNGCPPVLIQSDGWSGETLSVAGAVSSQYLSGLMMAAPIAAGRSGGTSRSTSLRVEGELVSVPYVQMTAEVMRCFSAEVSLDKTGDEDSSPLQINIKAGGYHSQDYAIEPDASAASYFWAAAAITGGDVTVNGLSRDALQGDVGFCDVLEQMGCEIIHGEDSIRVIGATLHGVDVDMNEISDTVQTLSIVALFADAPTRVRGVAHNRFKETDRIGDLAIELRKLGAVVDEHDDGLTIHPLTETDSFSGATLKTYHDHRMAMSLSLAGLRLPGVKILDPACTSKTYPEYFADLEQLIGRAHHWSN